MAKKKKPNKLINPLNIIVLLLVVICLSVLLFRNVFTKNQANLSESSNLDPTASLSFFNPVTPIIIPVNNSQKNLFSHPLNHFSFEYPNNWNITVEQHYRNKDWYEVLLTNSHEDDDFKIHFQVNGRDYPWYEEKIEYKIIGNKSIKWTTLFKEGNAVEAFTSFPNSDFGNNLIGLYIYLPKENQEEFIQQVEELIATLK